MRGGGGMEGILLLVLPYVADTVLFAAVAAADEGRMEEGREGGGWGG